MQHAGGAAELTSNGTAVVLAGNSIGGSLSRSGNRPG
jgi:hypothetical protein